MNPRMTRVGHCDSCHETKQLWIIAAWWAPQKDPHDDPLQMCRECAGTFFLRALSVAAMLVVIAFCAGYVW